MTLKTICKNIYLLDLQFKMAVFLASDDPVLRIGGNKQRAINFQKWMDNCHTAWWILIIQHLAMSENPDMFSNHLIMFVKTKQWLEAFALVKRFSLTEDQKCCFTEPFGPSLTPHLKATVETAANNLLILNEDFNKFKDTADLFTMTKYEVYKAKDHKYMMLFIKYGALRLNPPSTDDLAATKVRMEKKSKELFAQIGP